jgi:hypothetical protein
VCAVEEQHAGEPWLSPGRVQQRRRETTQVPRLVRDLGPFAIGYSGEVWICGRRRPPDAAVHHGTVSSDGNGGRGRREDGFLLVAAGSLWGRPSDTLAVLPHSSATSTSLPAKDAFMCLNQMIRDFMYIQILKQSLRNQRCMHAR